MRICANEMCLTQLTGNQTRFCGRECRNSYHNPGRYGKLNPRGAKKKGSKCKYCKDSNHTVFCSEEHKMFYRQFRNGIKSELARRKPKPTEKQLRAYKKLQGILANTVVNR